MSKVIHASFVTGFALLLAAFPIAASAWWDDAWRFRKPITYDAALEQAALAAGEDAVIVPLRLHAGNFSYFADARPDGADLRFVAADDRTPLVHSIERWDAASGIGLVWLRVPVPAPGPEARQFWMYYGNSKAGAPAGGSVHSPPTVAVYHFVDAEGPPRDSSGFSHDATRSTATAGAAGILDFGLEFTGADSVSLPATPLLAVDPAPGYTFGAWVNPAEGSAAGLLFSQVGATGQVELLVSGDAATLRWATAEAVTELPPAALIAGAWQHLAFTVAADLQLYVDGQLAATAPVPPLLLDGVPRLGAREDRAGFVGRIDELAVHAIARSADSIRLTRLVQSPDGELLQYGGDESRESVTDMFTELGLVYSLFGRMGFTGWFVIALIMVLGVISGDVMVAKLRWLHRLERADAAFRQRFAATWTADAARLESSAGVAAPAAQQEAEGLERIYAVAMQDVAALSAARGGQGDHRHATRTEPRALVTTRDLEVVRAGLDAVLVEESHRLNDRLVLMTLAVSGAPFLGLLGTVVGVMITFAAIAKSGDVNVNTIAPGVASALMTTVIGLLIAIPSMFGYNFVVTRVATRLAQLEVFADQLLTRIGATREEARAEEVPHAA